MMWIIETKNLNCAKNCLMEGVIVKFIKYIFKKTGLW